MYRVRAAMIWLLIIFAESVHGILREFFLVPLVGDFPARQIAFFGAVVLIFVIAYFGIRWIAAPTTRALFAVGGLWLILTALFEFGIGFFVMNYTPGQMLRDYDLSRGGLMGFGLLFLIFAPWLAEKARRVY